MWPNYKPKSIIKLKRSVKMFREFSLSALIFQEIFLSFPSFSYFFIFSRFFPDFPGFPWVLLILAYLKFRVKRYYMWQQNKYFVSEIKNDLWNNLVDKFLNLEYLLTCSLYLQPNRYCTSSWTQIKEERASPQFKDTVSL